MKKIKGLLDLTIVQKIALAGIFIVLVALFQKVFAVNYIPVLPFVRISFGGPALIIFASILLGPWFGMLVGAASDIIGFYMFDPKLMGSVPLFQITLLYALLGFGSYFIYKLVTLIKNEKVMLTIESCFFGLLLIGVSLFSVLYKNDSFLLWQRILIPVVSLNLLALTIFVQLFLTKYFKKKEMEVSPIHVGFASFIIEMTIMLCFGVAMKTWAFGSGMFLIILVSQVVVAFFNIPLNTFLVSYIMYLSKRLIKGKQSA